MRRARLQTLPADDLPDPIAAAAQAKREREEARIKAAAQAAAKAFAGKTKTVFFDLAPPTEANSEPKAQDTNGTGQSTSTNPLASILGYEQDDSASEDGSEPPSPRMSTDVAGTPTSLSADTASATAPASDEPGDELDTELASFMSELESSGLLKDEPVSAPKAPGGPVTETTPPPSDPTSSTPDLDLEASLANPAAAIVTAVTGASDTHSDAAAATADQADGAAASQPAAEAPADSTGRGSEGDVASTSAPAEQRVLGELLGAPQWHEVMDMATGKVYFWDSTTDEVAWEPPAGTQPRSKQETADTFAAHISAISTAPTSKTSAAEAAATETAATAALSAAAPAAVDSRLEGADAAAAKSASSESSVEHMDDTAPAEAQEQASSDQEDGELAATHDRATSTAEVAVAKFQAARPLSATSKLTDAAGHPVAAAGATGRHPDAIAVPSSDVAALGRSIAEQAQAALHTLCHDVPQLVRLAVEAEIRLQDWQMFAAKQQSAADKALPDEALTWKDFEDHVQWRWRSIEASMPDALTQAQQLRDRLSQEPEDGEMPPPLPIEEAVPSSNLPLHTSTSPVPAESSQPTVPLDDAPPPSSGDLPSQPSDPPPLPPSEDSGPSDPQTASEVSSEAAGTTPDAASRQEQIPDAAAQPGTGAATAAANGAGPSSEADMDLDMDVDAEGVDGGTSGRPVSADALPSSSGRQLPSWAGFYMAHNQAYPYYGQPAATAALPSLASTAPHSKLTSSSASATNEAADFLSSQLAGTTTAGAVATAPVEVTAASLAPPRKEYKAAPAPSPLPWPEADLAADGPSALSAASTPVLSTITQETEQKKRKRPKAPVSSSKLAVKKGKSSKGLGLVNKWQAVRKDMEEQEAKAEEELFPDAAAQERKRAQEAEKWRLQQLKAGTAPEDNANFQPLAVDWRDKIKGKRKATHSSASASTSPMTTAAQDNSSADGKPDLDLLSKGLPAGWRAMWDKNTGDIYYGNLKTRAIDTVTSGIAIPAGSKATRWQKVYTSDTKIRKRCGTDLDDTSYTRLKLAGAYEDLVSRV